MQEQNNTQAKEVGALIGQATDAQIKEWKEKHTLGVFAITSNNHIAYFREVDIKDLNEASALTTQDTSLDYYIVLGNTLYLGGSRELFEGKNTQLKLNFIATIRKKTIGIEGELVNL